MPQFIPLENDLTRVVNSAPLIVFQVDRNGIFTLSEGESLKSVGLSPGQAVGKSLYDMYKDYPLIISSFEKVLATGQDIKYTVEISDNLFFETKLTPIIQNGNILGVNGVSTDISDQKFLENELNESEERYRNLIEFAPFGILVMQQATAIFVNKRFTSIFGYENISEIIGKPGTTFLAPQVRQKLFKRSINREKGKSEPNEYETLGLKKSGKIFPMKVNMERIIYLGKPAIMGFFQDISEQKKAEEQNKQMIKQLMNTQKLESLGILAGGIAHDFNNLLVGIMGYTSLIMEKITDDEESIEYIKKIETTSKLASDLTKQMLNYSGKGKFQKEIISLKDLIIENKNLFRASVEKSSELIFNLNEDLPLVEIDTTQIRQVMINLISNASETINTATGIIKVNLYQTYLENEKDFVTYNKKFIPGEYIVFEVSDNGDGIQKEILDKIFDPFFTTKATGRGLGLAVVQGIISGHNGLINVQSQPNAGTSFKIFLPVKNGLAVSESKIEESEIKVGKKGTILICDDEEIVVDVASEMLQKIGFKTIIARDGLESLKIYEKYQNNIDLILLDLTMPKLHGEEVFKRIRSINSKAKIILSSGYTEKEVLVNFSGKNLSGFLQKPYTFQDIVNIVNKLN